MFIVTGGGTGIGKALALALAKRDKAVLIVGRRQACLEETADHSSLIDYLCADLSIDEGRKLLVQKVADVSSISGLINNAGTVYPIVPLKEMTWADWQLSLRTNVEPALFLPQKLYKQLAQGRVLNVGSGAAYIAIKGWGAYCASKAALAMLTRCWQIESESIAFSSVMPGIVDTDMQGIAREGVHMDIDVVNFYKNLKQTARLLRPDTVAEFLAWLLLDVDIKTYVSQEWDIYDPKHHHAWLKPPHQVVHWEGWDE